MDDTKEFTPIPTGYNNKVIEYNSLVTKIKNQLDLLKSSDIDVEKYENELNEIIKNTNEKREIKNGGTLVIGAMASEPIYNTASKNLRILDNKVKEENTIFKINCGCKVILENKDEYISEEELNKYIRMILSYIADINSLSITEYGKIEQTTLLLYKTAYEVIKLELLKSDSSIVLHQINLSADNIEFINNLVKEDLESIRGTDEKIDNHISNLTKDGLDVTLANELLIQLLLLKSHPELKTRIHNNIVKLSSKIYDEKDELIKKWNKNKELDSNINHAKSELQDTKSRASFNAILLAIGVFICCSSEKTSNDIAKTTCYETQIEYTDTLSDESKTYIINTNEKDEGDVTIIKYGETLEDGNRLITTYKLDYAPYDADYYKENTPNAKEESKIVPYSSFEQASDKEYVAVEKVISVDKQSPIETIDISAKETSKKILSTCSGIIIGGQMFNIMRSLFEIKKKKKEINKIEKEKHPTSELLEIKNTIDEDLDSLEQAKKRHKEICGYEYDGKAFSTFSQEYNYNEINIEEEKPKVKTKHKKKEK